MRLLLTNDDGYDAPGLRALADCVRALGHEAVVVAPDAPMSGASRSRRSGIPAPWRRAAPIAEIPGFRVDTTPAGCVVFALTSGLLPSVDLCVSGVNAGENLGASLGVSGTYGAVLEAAARGVRGVALSRGFGGVRNAPGAWDWTWVSEAGQRALALLLSTPSAWFTANVNLAEADRCADPAYTRVSRSLYYRDTYDVGAGGIVSEIAYQESELAPDDDVTVFAERHRTSITLFPPDRSARNAAGA